MILRKAFVADLPKLGPLYAAFFEEDGIPAVRDRIDANLAVMIDDPRATIIVAEDQGALVGLVSASLTFGVEFGWAAEMEDLYVVPEKRGVGVSRRLIAAALDWAETRDAVETFLVITPEAEANQGLTRFYAKFGFHDSRRVTMYRANRRHLAKEESRAS